MGTHLTTSVVKKEYAKVCLATSLEMPEGKKLTDYTIVTELKDADGKVVAQENSKAQLSPENSLNRNSSSSIRLSGLRILLHSILPNPKSTKAKH